MSLQPAKLLFNGYTLLGAFFACCVVGFLWVCFDVVFNVLYVCLLLLLDVWLFMYIFSDF